MVSAAHRSLFMDPWRLLYLNYLRARRAVKKFFRQPIDSFERRRNSLRSVGSNRFKALWCSRVWQYGLWRFYTGVTKLERFLPKNQHNQRKLLNFENWVNGEVSKSAKILSKSIFYFKNYPNLSQLFFHWRISIQEHNPILKIQ